MKVSEILRSKGDAIYSVSPDQRISDAVSLLNEKNIGAVVVKDDAGKPVGILSERDIVRKLGKEGAGVLSVMVSLCMTPDPVTCGNEATLDEVLNLMTKRRIRHMPVVFESNLVGIVTIGDVVKRKIDLAEQEAASLREYIAS